MVQLGRSSMSIMCGMVETNDIPIVQFEKRCESRVKYHFYGTNGTIVSTMNVNNVRNGRK